MTIERSKSHFVQLCRSRILSLNESIKIIIRFIAFSFVTFSLVTQLGCLPKEETITEVSGGETYGGFEGVDSVLTIASNKVKVSWTPSNSPSVVGYNIYDATISTFPKLVKSVSADRSEATIVGLSEGFYYAFRVRAVDKDGKEDVNIKDEVGIPYGGVTGVTVVSSTSAQVEFNSAADGEALEINVYCKTDGEYSLAANVRDTSKTSVILSDLIPSTTYTCRAAITVEGKEDNNTETVSFEPLGQASEIIFLTQPGNGEAGETLAQQPVVKILDANGNVVSGGPDATALITLEISAVSPTVGVVRGTATLNAVAGVATFSDINLQEAGIKVIKAVKEDTSAQFFGTVPKEVDSSTFIINPGPVSAALSTMTLTPAVPPGEPLVANGTDSYTLTATLKDQYANPVPGIRPTFESNIVGDFIIQPFQSSDDDGITTGTISSTVADSLPPFRVVSVSAPAGLSDIKALVPFKAGDPKKLIFTVQPMNSPAGDLAMNDVKVSITDAQGNVVVSGSGSTDSIGVSIASNTNGAILSGTSTVAAVAGVATFSDLGIDLTKNGYVLVASSGILTPAYSNSFNITAGVPQAVSMSGPTDVFSGSCSSGITIQLQDNGGNPAAAIQNTIVQLSGMGSAVLYSSSSCGGSALGSSVTFTPGTHTRTVYLKSNKVEALSLSATDSSAVMTAGTMNINVNPSKMSLLAQAAAPAPPGTVLSVAAGHCSTEIVITPLAFDGSEGPMYNATSVVVSGIVGSGATLYSDAGCSMALDPLNVPMTVGLAPNHKTKLYIKDPIGENLTISVSDSGGNIATVSTPQAVRVTASDLDFSGPTAVVAGQCSSAFTIALHDTADNAVNTVGDLELSINGVDGVSTSGQFYTSPACSGAGSTTTLTIPDGSSSAQIYFRGIAAEILDISISDPNGIMTTSQTIQLIVSPSALRITGPGPTSSKSSDCVGPFSVETLDGEANVAAAVTPIVVNLSGQGVAGFYYLDSNCATEISGMSFSNGDSSKAFYFTGQYPDSLTLTASDNGAVLSSGTLNWDVTADVNWLGTASTMFDGNGDLYWFESGVKPVAARYDGINSAMKLEFSPDSQYLYVVDYYAHKISKYDYLNNEYIGWVGSLDKEAGIGSTGSNLATPSPALCVNTANADPLPGWCKGGRPWTGDLNIGGLRYPYGLKDDGSYIYVALYHDHMINRYDSTTGAYAGWIGLVNNSTPTAAGPGGPVGCTSVPNGSVTPGWCIGGNNTSGTSYIGDGRVTYPTDVETDATYLYVTSYGAVLRFNKSNGSFSGWIGMVDQTPTGGSAPGCTATGSNQLTPGWCTGGTWKRVDPRNHSGVAGGFEHPRSLILKDGFLYVVSQNYGGQIGKYDAVTGAFIELLPNALSNNWQGPYQITTDGTKFYVADNERVIKVDTTGLVEGWMGKVANNAGMSGNVGCDSLQPNENTPGWCLGGMSKPGLDEDSFIATRAIAYDGNGAILVSGERFPGIKKFDSSTGQLIGTLGLRSISPKRWSDNNSLNVEYHGLDDHSTYNPVGMVVVGDFLFVAEREGSRVKKINRKTGDLIGWIGGTTSKPTGGQTANCLLTNGMGPSPGWCLGANFYPTFTWNNASMIDDLADGIMQRPFGLTSDGTWLYITDYERHRIQRFNVDTGVYGGWIGRINASPTGGDPGCNGAAAGSYTPGWCLGGRSEAGTADGNLRYPSGIHYHAGNLYVVDGQNYRISSYGAVTGAFNGWIGRIGSAPSSGCTPTHNGNYNVSGSGWCIGGTASRGNSRGDRGGGFYFSDNNWGDVTTDGVHLYITNGENARVDKFTMGGQFVAAVSGRQDLYTRTWETDPGVIASQSNSWCSRPIAIWIDSGYMYGLNRYPCQQQESTMALFKMDLSTGQILGWKGTIYADNPPVGGDPGCVGATTYTPGWCQGGRSTIGAKKGQFIGSFGYMTGDAHYLYVTDYYGNRISRIPK
ncbi:MAG: fibronectin type III domain-containing protein [Bdellovibrionales bacterium]|nr:fibronectin type III domain-containing protein [Bdellovibrionales bacterium]